MPYTLTDWQPIVFSGRSATLPNGTPSNFMLLDQGFILEEGKDYTVSESTVTLDYDPARPSTGFIVGWTTATGGSNFNWTLVGSGLTVTNGGQTIERTLGTGYGPSAYDASASFLGSGNFTFNVTPQTSGWSAIALSTSTNNSNYNVPEYYMEFSSVNGVTLYTSGTAVANNVTTFIPNVDEFQLVNNAGVVTAKKNGNVIHTFALNSSSLTLYPAVVIYQQNSILTGMTFTT